MFDVTGTTAYAGVPPSGSLTGTVSLNSLTGLFTAASLVYTTPNDTMMFYDPTLDADETTQVLVGSDTFTEATFTGVDTYGTDLEMTLIIAGSLVNYTGGPICGVDSSCDGLYSASEFATAGYGVTDVVSGQLMAAPLTPEPGSLALLGTGMLGMAGYVRRRITRI